MLVVRFVGLDQFASHISDKDCTIHFSQALDCIRQAIATDDASLILTSIANATDNAEKIQSNNSLVGVQLLRDSRKEIRVSQAECYGWAQA